jgi:serine/threonine-protein kinase
MNCPACQAANDASATACTACGAGLNPVSLVVTVDLSPGTLFHGRYEIVGPLGSGGMGIVYKAHDRKLDETVAIKVLRPDIAQDPGIAQRFRSEIKLARKVRHENVCAIHEYGEDHGVLFISMEFIDGTDLKRVLKTQGALPAERAFDVAIQTAAGLQAVHDKGIIHRDLKAPNIMLDRQGVARLMDFGLAKRQGGETAATASGHVVGTPEYMSPEQAQGLALDPRCDIYALGVVIFEAFSGVVPFRGDTPIATILKHIHDPPPLDGGIAERIPPGVRPILRRALSKDPRDRYASARELAEALRRTRSGGPAGVSADTPTVTRSGWRVGTRVGASTRWWLVAAPLVTAMGGFWAFRALMPDEPTSTPSPLAPSIRPTPSPDPTPTAAASVARMSDPAPRPASEPARPRATASFVPTSTPLTSPPPPVASARPAPPSPTPEVLATPATDGPAPSPSPSTLVRVQGTGYLQLGVLPWATVFVDGRPWGETPREKIPLDAGTHGLRLEFPDYEPHEASVTIRPGQTEVYSFDFRKAGVRRRQP